jgi:hypothetical protein
MQPVIWQTDEASTSPTMALEELSAKTRQGEGPVRQHGLVTGPSRA